MIPICIVEVAGIAIEVKVQAMVIVKVTDFGVKATEVLLKMKV